MHYSLEVIMPPTDEITGALDSILNPFSESQSADDEEGCAAHAFWDWWQIGGRFSGHKLESLLTDADKEAFFAALKDRKVTVSGLQWGKQELSPPSQIAVVDALWRDMFPRHPFKVCPFFKHSGDQMEGDVCRVSDLPPAAAAFHVIVAGPDYQDKLRAVTMLTKKVWNGVTHQETTWSGSISDALRIHSERIEHYRDDYKAKCAVAPDWLCVTVDYHS